MNIITILSKVLISTRNSYETDNTYKDYHIIAPLWKYNLVRNQKKISVPFCDVMSIVHINLLLVLLSKLLILNK